MNVAQLFNAAKARHITVVTAESCTGGLVSAAITDVAGSSVIFDRGYVTYSNEAKIQMLGVAPQTLAKHGAVSEDVAREMALGALARSNAQVAVSITGIAGPGGSEHKPEGRVCFGIAQEGYAQTETIEFGAIGRAEVRRAACDHAIGLLGNLVDSFAPLN